MPRRIGERERGHLDRPDCVNFGETGETELVIYLFRIHRWEHNEDIFGG